MRKWQQWAGLVVSLPLFVFLFIRFFVCLYFLLCKLVKNYIYIYIYIKEKGGLYLIFFYNSVFFLNDNE